MNKSNEILWYPLRVTYSREMKIKEYFDTHSVDSFIPMHYVEKQQHGHAHRVLVPIIHNLIFVHTSKDYIDEIKRDPVLSTQIRYMMDQETHLPIVIPEKQMQDFIAVAGSFDEQILYLDPQEVALKKGDRVRVTGGIWKGIEGKFVRIKRGLHVVITLNGIAAVATTCLHPSLIEKID